MKRRPCPIIRDRQVPTGHRSDPLLQESYPPPAWDILLGTAGSVCAVSAAADAAPGMTDHTTQPISWGATMATIAMILPTIVGIFALSHQIPL